MEAGGRKLASLEVARREPMSPFETTDLEQYLLPPHKMWLYYLAFPALAVGLASIGAGYVACLAGAVMMIRMISVLYGSIAFFLGSLFVEFGKFLFIKGRKFLSIKRQHELMRSFDPKILYLRSFVSDKSTRQVVSTGYRLNLANLLRLPDLSASTEEHLLFTIFEKVGTPVAVGKPGEILPEVGFPRIYLDEDWQPVVRRLIASVEWVFIRADDSEGLWTEIEMALSMKRPDRVVLIIPFPDDRQGFDRFRSKLQRLVPKELPFIYGSEILGTEITGLIYFDRDLRPGMIDISQAAEFCFGRGETSIRRILETAFFNIPNFSPSAGSLQSRTGIQG
jgi:hypothetical protein